MRTSLKLILLATFGLALGSLCHAESGSETMSSPQIGGYAQSGQGVLPTILPTPLSGLTPLTGIYITPSGGTGPTPGVGFIAIPPNSIWMNPSTNSATPTPYPMATCTGNYAVEQYNNGFQCAAIPTPTATATTTPTATATPFTGLTITGTTGISVTPSIMSGPTPSTTISCAAGTSSVLGCVKPDGTTITNTSGAIAAAATTINGTTCTPGGSCTPAPVQTITKWTPTDNSGAGLTFTDGSSACNTTTHVCASSTQLGNMVFAYAVFHYPATADMSAASISGLPVNSASIYGAQVCGLSTNAATINTIGEVGAASEIVNILSAISRTAITNANLTTAIVILTCAYPAT